MKLRNPNPFSLFYLFCVAAFGLELELDHPAGNGIGGRRALLSFKETPSGSNLTYDCSPSGPCVPCLYYEKKEAKYRCSETGYRIPLKCVVTKDILKDAKGTKSKKSQNGRSTEEIFQNNAEHLVSNDAMYEHGRSLEGSSTEDMQAYITYRSCIPPISEEKVSVMGFEVIVLGLLLISSSVVYFRRKRNVTMPGVGSGTGRIQMNSRF